MRISAGPLDVTENVAPAAKKPKFCSAQVIRARFGLVLVFLSASAFSSVGRADDACDAQIADETGTPGQTVSPFCAVTNNGVADETFDWTVTKTGGVVDVTLVPANGTVMVPAQSSAIVSIDVQIGANTIGGTATLEFEVKLGGVVECSATGTITVFDGWVVNDTPKAWQILNTRNSASLFYKLHEGVDVPAHTQNPGGNIDGNKVLLPRRMKLYVKTASKVRFETTFGGSTYYCAFLHLRGIPAGLAEGTTYAKGTLLGYIDNDYADPVPDHLHYSVSTTNWETNIRTAFEDAINPLKHYEFTAGGKDPQGVRPEFIDRANPQAVDADGESFQFKDDGSDTYFTAKAPDGNFIIKGDVDFVPEVQDKMNFAAWYPDVYKSAYWVKRKKVCGGHDVRTAASPYVLFEATELAVDDANNLSKMDVVYETSTKDFTRGLKRNYHPVLTNTKGTTGAWDQLDSAQHWNTNAKNAGNSGGNGVDTTANNDATKAKDAWFPDGLYEVKAKIWDLIGETEKTVPVYVDNFPPAVKEKAPGGGGGGDGRNAEDCVVVIVFSEPMNRPSVESAITWVKVDGGPVTYTASWNDTGCTITLTPTGQLEAGNYTVKLDADTAKDLYGGTSHNGALLDSEFPAGAHNGTAEGDPIDSVEWTFPCGAPGEGETGSCCTEGDCIDHVTTQTCAELDGAWLGADSTCAGDNNENGIDDTCECVGCPGDIDVSGVVDAADTTGFVSTLLDANPCGDSNQDGTTDGLDVSMFVALVMANGGYGTPCPGVTCVPPGQDCWSTLCNGTTGYDFTDTPLPLGFFGGGSDPFSGQLEIGGRRAQLDPDTYMARLDQMCFREPLPSTASTPIELTALDLVGCQSMTVTYNGGQNPETWDVEVGLSSFVVQQGSLTATKTHENGGTFDADFFVQPVFTFTKVGDPGQVRTFDTGLEGFAAMQLGTTGVPWLQDDPIGVACSPGFSPGQTEVDGDPCCVERCHSSFGTAPHDHCSVPPRCDLCPEALTGACCQQDGTCVDGETEENCAGGGGFYNGDGSDCGGANCLPAVCVPPGEDCFTTACGQTGYGFDQTPIPVGFFGSGTDPFSGFVQLGGTGSGPLGTDTGITRLDEMCFFEPLPATVESPIEVSRLELASCVPIIVTSNGGQNPVLWTVEVGLSSVPAPQGTLTATKTHANGGTFDVHFDVQPRFTFTRLDDPGDVRTFDTGELGFPPMLLSTTGAPWLHNEPFGSACSPDFAPGFDEDQGEPCCVESCHSSFGTAPHDHCVTPPACDLCSAPPTGACCLSDGSCGAGQTQEDCTSAGGTYQGDGTDCVTATCLPDVCVGPDDDCWSTACGPTGYGFDETPLPVDFFGLGSDPFSGFVQLGGMGTGPLGTDTTMTRLDEMCFADPPPSSASVDIELTRLELVSCSPIDVTYDGGQYSRQWDVEVGPSSVGPAPVGTLQATKTHFNGGTFDVIFFVRPVFTFTSVDDPTDVRVFDTALEQIAPLALSTSGVPWVHNASFPSCSPDFVPGVDDNQGNPCCDERCHSSFGTAPHEHCVTPPECFEQCQPSEPGDTCADAILVGGIPYVAVGDTCLFMDDYDEECPFCCATAPDAVYAYTPPIDEIVTITLCTASAYDTKVYVYENVCQVPGDGVLPYACNDDQCSTPNFPDPFVSEIPGLLLLGGNTYYIVVDGYDVQCGSYSLDMQ